MLKDEIYFLLHLQQHGRMYEVYYCYPALPLLSSWIFISCCAPHSSTLDSCSNAAGLRTDVRAAANGSRVFKSSIIIIQLDIYILLCTAQQHIGQLQDSGLQHCCSIASNAG
jgi:hypothetical protein